MDVGEILDLIATAMTKKFKDLKRNERSIIAMVDGAKFSVRVKQRKPKTAATKAKRKATKTAA